MLVLSIGVREAARQMGLNEKTVLHWSHTLGWLAHTRPQPKPVLPLSMQPRSVVSVTPADALSNLILEDGNATKVAGMKFARRTVEAAADLASVDPLKALVSAGDVKASLQSAAIAGSWAGSGSPSLRLTMFGPSGPVVDVESSYSPE